MSVFTTADQVAEEIAARVATINVADGFQTDIGTNVYDGRVQVDDEMPPCTSIIEGADRVEQGPSTRFATAHVKQGYALVAYAACDPEHPNRQARKMIADMKRAIFRTDGKADPTWGGKVRRVEYRGRNIGPRADGVAMVMAVIEIEVEFAENLAGA